MNMLSVFVLSERRTGESLRGGIFAGADGCDESVDFGRNRVGDVGFFGVVGGGEVLFIVRLILRADENHGAAADGVVALGGHVFTCYFADADVNAVDGVVILEVNSVAVNSEQAMHARDVTFMRKGDVAFFGASQRVTVAMPFGEGMDVRLAGAVGYNQSEHNKSKMTE